MGERRNPSTLGLVEKAVSSIPGHGQASLKIDDPSVKVISDYAPWHAVPVPFGRCDRGKRPWEWPDFQ